MAQHGGQGGKPQPGLRRLSGTGDVVDLETGRRIHQHFPAIPLKTPVGGEKTAAHRDPFMAHQILGPGDGRAARQILGAGAEQASRAPQAPCRQAGVAHVAYSHYGIQPLADGIHDAIGQLQIHSQPRIGLQKVGHQPTHHQLPRLDGHRQLEGPRHLLLTGAQHQFGLGQLLHRLAAAQVILLPRFGQGELAGGAIEQPHAEVLLQIGDAAAHRRLGHAQLLGRCGEGAFVNDAHQNQGCVQVHCLTSETVYLMNGY
ncbi:hypothetical protein D3C85_655650 [compost metagenome]